MTEISLAVLQETVRAQGEETRRSIEMLRAMLADALEKFQQDHDRLTRLEGQLNTEVERAVGEHRRLFTITDGLTQELGRLSNRDRWEAIALLVATVIAAALGLVK